MPEDDPAQPLRHKSTTEDDDDTAPPSSVMIGTKPKPTTSDEHYQPLAAHNYDHHSSSGRPRWKQSLHDFFLSRGFHLGVVIFVLLDCVLVVFELMIEWHIQLLPEDHREEAHHDFDVYERVTYTFPDSFRLNRYLDLDPHRPSSGPHSPF